MSWHEHARDINDIHKNCKVLNKRIQKMLRTRLVSGYYKSKNKKVLIRVEAGEGTRMEKIFVIQHGKESLGTVFFGKVYAFPYPVDRPGFKTLNKVLDFIFRRKTLFYKHCFLERFSDDGIVHGDFEFIGG